MNKGNTTMKKTLKTLALCSLSIVIGIVIGSSSKRLLGGSFSNVNSSPEKVVENYIIGSYLHDEKTIKKCLSDDLNDIDMLEYLSLKGFNLAEDNLYLYQRSLNFKKNPPQDITKEELKVHNTIIKKVENKEFTEVHARSKVEQMKEKMIGMESIEDLKVKVEILEKENEPIRDGVDKGYIGIKFKVTQSYNGSQNESEDYIVIQEKSNKYYIVNMPRTWY